MANQETAISEAQLDKIVHMLRSSKMTVPEIARRTGYSRSVVASIKRRVEIRKRRPGMLRKDSSVS
jgi:hypothetical protein